MAKGRIFTLKRKKKDQIVVDGRGDATTVSGRQKRSMRLALIALGRPVSGRQRRKLRKEMRTRR